MGTQSYKTLSSKPKVCTDGDDDDDDDDDDDW